MYSMFKMIGLFQAITIYRITTVEQPPFIMKVKGEDGKTKFEGYCIDLIENIREIVGFEWVSSWVMTKD